MADKTWMLNPQTIRCAKECVEIIKRELGIKLKLSHPNFIQTLHEHVDMLGNKELSMAYSRLISMAGAGAIMQSLRAPTKDYERDIPVAQAVGDVPTLNQHYESDETIDFEGEIYRKWYHGREFKGVFKGRPIY